MEALVAEYERLGRNLLNAKEERHQIAIYNSMQRIADEIFKNHNVNNR